MDDLSQALEQMYVSIATLSRYVRIYPAYHASVRERASELEQLITSVIKAHEHLVFSIRSDTQASDIEHKLHALGIEAIEIFGEVRAEELAEFFRVAERASRAASDIVTLIDLTRNVRPVFSKLLDEDTHRFVEEALQEQWAHGTRSEGEVLLDSFERQRYRDWNEPEDLAEPIYLYTQSASHLKAVSADWDQYDIETRIIDGLIWVAQKQKEQSEISEVLVRHALRLTEKEQYGLAVGLLERIAKVRTTLQEPDIYRQIVDKLSEPLRVEGMLHHLARDSQLLESLTNLLAKLDPEVVVPLITAQIAHTVDFESRALFVKILLGFPTDLKKRVVAPVTMRDVSYIRGILDTLAGLEEPCDDWVWPLILRGLASKDRVATCLGLQVDLERWHSEEGKGLLLHHLDHSDELIRRAAVAQFARYYPQDWSTRVKTMFQEGHVLHSSRELRLYLKTWWECDNDDARTSLIEKVSQTRGFFNRSSRRWAMLAARVLAELKDEEGLELVGSKANSTLVHQELREYYRSILAMEFSQEPDPEPAADDTPPTVVEDDTSRGGTLTVERTQSGEDQSRRKAMALYVQLHKACQHLHREKVSMDQSARRIVRVLRDEPLERKDPILFAISRRTFPNDVSTLAANAAVLSMILSRSIGLRRNAVALTAETTIEYVMACALATESEDQQLPESTFEAIRQARKSPVLPRSLLVILERGLPWNREIEGLHLSPPRFPHLLTRLVDTSVCAASLFAGATGEALPFPSVFDHLMTRSDESFDPRLVRALVNDIGYYPPGTIVHLSNDTRAVVASSVRKDREVSHSTAHLPLLRNLDSGELLDLYDRQGELEITDVEP